MRQLNPTTITFAVALVVCACARGDHPPTQAPARSPQLAERGVEPARPNRWSRAGDLVLTGSTGATLTIATEPDRPDWRPLRGSILDVSADAEAGDPILWWSPAWIAADGTRHRLVASEVAAFDCADGNEGIRASGVVDGVELATELCPAKDGSFALETTAQGLPEGAAIAEEIHHGTAPFLVARSPRWWDGSRESGFVAIAEDGTGILIEPAEQLRVQRKLVRIGPEVFPVPIAVIYRGNPARRTVHVARGDVLDALARLGAGATRTQELPPSPAAEITLFDEAGDELTRGALTPGEPAQLALPEGLAFTAALRDSRGIPLGDRFDIAVGSTPPSLPGTIAAGELGLRYLDERGRPLPVRVLIRGVEGTPDPEPRLDGERAHAAANVLYLLDGAAQLELAPGSYEVVATHGLTHSAAVHRVTLGDRGEEQIAGELARVVDTAGWLSADMHVHCAFSGDSRVSLEQRVASLVTNGVDVVASTDHNFRTDYRDAVAALGLADALVALAGDELTTKGDLWGHFSVFPLAPPVQADDPAVPGFYEQTPEELFAEARQQGARVIQVNHPRMPPRIGYFDRIGFEARTGSAGPQFSDGFDTVEVFNGLWIESPERVRDNLVDLVGLVRRGSRPIATGNSDSHKLYLQEVGYPRTYVQANREPLVSRPGRFLDALLRGATTISSGPFVELTVGDEPIGAVVDASGQRTIEVTVRVSAPAWVPVERVELWSNGQVIERRELTDAPRDGVRFEELITLAVDGDAALLAYADADSRLPYMLPYEQPRPIGFTSLTYIDADGDGRIELPEGATK